VKFSLVLRNYNDVSETQRIILDKSSAPLFITFNKITGFYHKGERTTKTGFDSLNMLNPN